MNHPPSRLRDRALDDEVPRPDRAGGTAIADPVASDHHPASDSLDVVCWTPVASPTESGSDVAPDRRELRATLLAEPSLPGTTDDPVSHTLVLEVDEPTAAIEIDYRPLDATIVPERGVRVRTDDDRPVTVDEAQIGADGTFVVTFADSPSDGALFLEYSVTQNPDGGRHTVGVVVDGKRRTEARLVVVG